MCEKAYFKLIFAMIVLTVSRQMMIQATYRPSAVECSHAPQTLTEWSYLYGDDAPRAGVEETVVSVQSFAHMLRSVEESNANAVRKHVINPVITSADSEAVQEEFMYIQKVVLPVHSTVYCWGDIHGDVRSLIAVLTYLKERSIIDDHLRILRPDVYIISCGDFVDRGEHGVEVLSILCQLQQQNPDHVFLIRGNHEEIRMNKRYGFYTECCRKFSIHGADYLFNSRVSSFYGALPVALYVGVEREHGLPEYIQFCHGGLEFYDVSSLLAHADTRAVELIRSLYRKTVYAHALSLSSTEKPCIDISTSLAIADDILPNAGSIGFLWSDFNAGYRVVGCKYMPTDTKVTYYTEGRGFLFGQCLTDALTAAISGAARIVAIIRAHQHNPSMPQLIGSNASPNRSVYKLFSQCSSQVTVITTVLTTQYASDRGFLVIDFPSAWSDTWTLQGLWQSKGNGASWKMHQKNTFAAWRNVVE